LATPRRGGPLRHDRQQRAPRDRSLAVQQPARASVRRRRPRRAVGVARRRRRS